VAPGCECEPQTAEPADLGDPASASLLCKLVSPEPPLGGPSRSELLWGGLKSKAQWYVSAGVTLLITPAILLSIGESTTDAVVATVVILALMTFAVRWSVLAFELILRVLVALIDLLIAGGCSIVGWIRDSDGPRAAASDWIVRADRALNGLYWYWRPAVELRAVSVSEGEGEKGTLPPAGDLIVLVSRGKRGTLRLRDAELPEFDVVLSSGETIAVSVESGALSFGQPNIEASERLAVSALFGTTRQIVVRGAASVVLLGGEWGTTEQRADYRASPERRLLRGTTSSPLHVSFG